MQAATFLTLRYRNTYMKADSSLATTSARARHHCASCWAGTYYRGRFPLLLGHDSRKQQSSSTVRRRRPRRHQRPSRRRHYRHQQRCLVHAYISRISAGQVCGACGLYAFLYSSQRHHHRKSCESQSFNAPAHAPTTTSPPDDITENMSSYFSKKYHAIFLSPHRPRPASRIGRLASDEACERSRAATELFAIYTPPLLVTLLLLITLTAAATMPLVLTRMSR